MVRIHLVIIGGIILLLGTCPGLQAQEVAFPEHYKGNLAHFIGSWEGRLHQEYRNGAKTTVPAHAVGTYILDSSAVEVNLKLGVPDMGYVKFRDVIGWDSKDSTITVYGASNVGQMYAFTGSWTMDGTPKLVLKREDVKDGRSRTLDHSYAFPDENTMVINYTSDEDDESTPLVVITVQRK